MDSVYVSRLRCTLAIVSAACVLGFVPTMALAQGLQSTGCDSDQLNRIGDAIYYAGFAFISAGDDISSIQNGGDTTRFDNWFGDHPPDTVNHVYNTLLGAYSALGDASFDCGCNIPTS